MANPTSRTRSETPGAAPGLGILTELQASGRAMLDDLRPLVEAESPSGDLDALNHCADVLQAIGEERIGRAATRASEGPPILEWSLGDGPPAVLLVGHLDTVWPVGTLASRPFVVEGDRAMGPGVFDMKAGLVIGIWAMRALRNRRIPVSARLLVNSDEELGSPSSTPYIRQVAENAIAALVLEPSHHGALKTQRWGRTVYELTVTGRAAHAGLAATDGANALVELSRVIHEIDEIAVTGASVIPTVGHSGVAANVVPDRATLTVDARYRNDAAGASVARLIRRLQYPRGLCSIEVGTGHVSPPLERRMSASLFAQAQEVARDLGLSELEEAEVGGGSDGNTCAAAGCWTLDGLGAVGDGAHASHEWVDLASLPERAALVADLTYRLTLGLGTKL